MSEQFKDRLELTANNSVDRKFISDIYQSNWNRKVFNPELSPHATSALRDHRNNWAKNGKTTILTTGTFDLKHSKHIMHLTHAKLTGAEMHYNRFHKGASGKPWHELEQEERRAGMINMLGTGALKLIVSIDRGSDVADISDTPISPWNTRADSVANASIPLIRAGILSVIDAVDAVTIHGIGDYTKQSPHYSPHSLVNELQPDIWTVIEGPEESTL